MSRDLVRVTEEILGSKYPIEGFTMSTTKYKSKEVDHTVRISFSLLVEGMGHDAI
jgi:hypothetical protein